MNIKKGKERNLSSATELLFDFLLRSLSSYIKTERHNCPEQATIVYSALLFVHKATGEELWQ